MKIEHLIFHLDCFTCDICDRQLMSGDKYAIQKGDHRIICEVDYELESASAADSRVTDGGRQQTEDQEDVADTSNTSTQSSDNGINISHLDDAPLNKNSIETGKWSAELDSSVPHKRLRCSVTIVIGLLCDLVFQTFAYWVCLDHFCTMVSWSLVSLCLLWPTVINLVVYGLCGFLVSCELRYFMYCGLLCPVVSCVLWSHDILCTSFRSK